MLAAQVHRDRARADHTATTSAPRRTSHHVKGRRKGSAGTGQPSFDDDRAQTFMANRDAAAATISGPRSMHRGSVALGATKRKRSSVVAIVKKRVDMLHMSVIAREFSQVVGDEEETRQALIRKQDQARATWGEMCTIPDPERNPSTGATSAAALAAAAAAALPLAWGKGRRTSAGHVGAVNDGGTEDEEHDDGRNAEDTDLPIGSKWLVHPHARKKVKWDLMVAVLIVYSTLSVPFRIGFDQTAGLMGSIVDGVVDIVFALDIVISFRTAFIDENGETVVDRRQICERYLKNWFTIDFVSTLPVDKLALLVAGSNDNAVLRSTKMLRILRLARLFKLVRLFKLQSKVIGGDDASSKINPSVMSLLKMLTYMTYIAHILGCMWHWLSTFEKEGMNWVTYFGVDEEPLTTRYVASIYWAFTTMTTVGYGDVVVTTTLERAFCVVGMLIGATVFGYIVGNVSVMMESFDLQSALRTQKMDRVKEYIISRRFPQKFSQRMLNQYKYHYKRVSVFDNYSIMESLPTTARTNLLFAQYHDAVDQISFLQNNPPVFVARLVGYLTPSYAKPGDVLLYQDEVGSDLYFMVTGRVNLFVAFSATIEHEVVSSARGTKGGDCAVSAGGPYAVQMFSFGKLFKDAKVGEVGVMLDLQQPCAAVAMAMCDLFTVGKEDLLSVLDGYLDVQASLINDAEDFMKRLEEFKKKKGAEPELSEELEEMQRPPLSSRARNAAAKATPRGSASARGGVADGGGGGSDGDGGGGGGGGGGQKESGEPSVTAATSPEPAGTATTPTTAAAGASPTEGTSPTATTRRHRSREPGHLSTIQLSRLVCMDGVGGSGTGSSSRSSDGNNTVGSNSNVPGSRESGGEGGGGGGLSVASMVTRKKPKSGLSDAASGNRSTNNNSISSCDRDSDDDDDDDDNPASFAAVSPLTARKTEEQQQQQRGRMGPRRSVVSQQLMDLADLSAADTAPSNRAHSSLVRSMSMARKFRRGSKKILPTDGSPYKSRLSRSFSGVSVASDVMSQIRGVAEDEEDSSSGSGIDDIDEHVDTVDDEHDLEGFGLEGEIEEEGVTPAPSPATARDIEAGNSLDGGSGGNPWGVHGPLAATVGGVAGGAKGAPNVLPLRPIVVRPYDGGRGGGGRGGRGGGGRGELSTIANPAHSMQRTTNKPTAHVSHSPKLVKSQHMHVGSHNQLEELDSNSEIGVEKNAESFEHQKKKNLNFLNVHQDTQTLIMMHSQSVQQLALNELSPHMFWGTLRIIHPDSMIKAIWDVFVAFFIVFSVVEVTFRLGFDAHAVGSWAVFDSMVDVIFFVDMLVSFNTAHWDDGNIVTDRKLITKDYLKGWFVVDLVSTVPLDTLLSNALQNANALRGTKLIRMIRLVRLFKIFRLLKMSTFFERYEEVMPMNPAVVRLTKLIVLMSFAAHLAACVWYAVGAQSIAKGRSSWISDYCLNDGVYTSCLDDSGLGARYMASVYWAFTTMTTVGYGDITPANNVPEMMTALVSEVAGTTLFAYVIGALVSIVLNLDPQNRLRKQQVEYMSEYMRDFNMTQKQKTEMKRHFNFKLSFNSVFPEVDILSILPPYLRIPAVLYSYRASLPRLPLLCQIEMSYPGFLGILLPRLKPGEYAKGDLIVSPRLGAQEMGFVLHGICEGSSVDNGRTIQTYREGQYLGHATLLVPDGVSFKVLIEVRAVMRVEMLILHKLDFDWLLNFYPPPMERLRDELTDWVQVLQWISLPKVYTKKIRRIVQRAASIGVPPPVPALAGGGGGGGGMAESVGEIEAIVLRAR